MAKIKSLEVLGPPSVFAAPPAVILRTQQTSEKYFLYFEFDSNPPDSSVSFQNAMTMQSMDMYFDVVNIEFVSLSII